MFCDIKTQLGSPSILQIMALSVYEESLERTIAKAQAYRENDAQHLYGWLENETVLGVCGFIIHSDKVEITNISVVATERKRGIGSSMVTALRTKYEMPIEAETDDDAVDFYRKCGFVTRITSQKNGVRRWLCILPAFQKNENVDVSRLSDIPDYNSFVKIEPINKGQSNDKKYYIETIDNKRLLLRVTDIAEYDRKKGEYDMLKHVYELGVPTPQPVDFGLCDGGKSVYSLAGWLDGEDAETLIPCMSEAEQYSTGLKAGAMLRKIHTLSAPDDAEPWEIRFQRKVQTRIDLYIKNNLESENGDKIIKYLRDKQNLLNNRQQTFWHGDFNVGNHMIMPDGEIATFDYNYWNMDYGDPWWEFVLIPWGKEPPAHYITGMINGYFNSNPPREFFDLLSYYYACDALSARCYTFLGTEPYEPEEGIQHMENILRWFDDMRNPVPTWYLKDFYIQWIDGVPYKLKAPFDFSFLSKYGKVFKVFDGQDSGNICFGVKTDDCKRYFIKFAGAPTAEYVADTESAIERLKEAVHVYKDLAHPNLIHFVKADEIGDGFAVVFEWVDGICAHPMYPNDYRKFKQIPLINRLQMYESILDFHAFVAKQGYIAVDFYDGSIMWDFVNERVLICDIDFYKKSQAYGSNPLWGHMQSASPEERTDGAVIDEVSNVYNMGETAFTLFIGRKSSRSRDDWPLSDALYDVAKRAVSDERGERQQSIEQLIAEWRRRKHDYIQES